MTSPIESLAGAWYTALLQDLDDVMEEQYRYERVATGESKARRPRPSECSVLAMFEQSWPDTSCGFGGLAGQAFTNAYTIVVQGAAGEVCVYFAGRLAYRLARPNEQFFQDLARRSLLEVRRSHEYRAT